MVCFNDAVCGGDALEVFSVDSISYTYRDGNKALDNVSLSVLEGESLTIIGANGSGKSTLLYILDGILKPDSGEIRVFGQPLKDDFNRFRHRVSLLFQNPQVQLFSLSVWDELCFGPLQLGLGNDETGKRASDILKLMEIEHLKDRGPWNLSSGEMKKVALGTCLSINPDVILLDEPTTGLDPRSQVELVDIIMALKESGKTIITATHDLGVIEDISDRTIVFGEDHRTILEGKPWEVMKNRDALLHANLIHKHTHRHSWYVHEHSHSGIHDHEHIPEISDGLLSEATRTVDMSDMEKLKMLIAYWGEHNIEHAETYIQWSETARSLGSVNLSDILAELAARTKNSDELFEKAKKLFKDKQ